MKESSIEAFPLHWPVGYPRTEHPQRSQFQLKRDAKPELIEEIRRLGGRDIIISSNISLRWDGLPYANQKTPDDTGVAVYFTHQGQQVVFACDKWNKVNDNMRAITKTIEALRGLERWGVSDMLNRTFQGFKAIPANISMSWEQVLGVPRNASPDEIKSKYRQLLKSVHPDHGGDPEEFHRVQEAYEQAIKSA